jgi:dTMP kinase
MGDTGLFITFEGVEGAGKTSHIRRLVHALTGRGLAVLATREPGGHPLGEEIRHLLLTAPTAPTPRSELLLFLAARAQLVETVIRPHLEAGGVVICDRFIDSTLAYQGYARGAKLGRLGAGTATEEWVETVRELNDIATDGLKPVATILLDLDPETGLARQKDHNRMESEDLEFHRRVRNGYLAEVAREPQRFRIIDASRSPDEVYRDILAAIQPLLTN